MNSGISGKIAGIEFPPSVNIDFLNNFPSEANNMKESMTSMNMKKSISGAESSEFFKLKDPTDNSEILVPKRKIRDISSNSLGYELNR